MLSVVIPAYCEEEMVPVAAREIGRILQDAHIEYELVFVDDGSKDATWEKISEAAREDFHVRGARFSRNFGKEAAIFAGLQQSRGDCVACIDCDLQHPPEKLVEMYRLWEQGYEVIEGVKSDRGKESVIHRAFTKLFYNIISRATKVDMTRAVSTTSRNTTMPSAQPIQMQWSFLSTSWTMRTMSLENMV